MAAAVGRAEPPRTRSETGSVNPVTFSENVTVNWICGSDVGSAWPAAGDQRVHRGPGWGNPPEDLRTGHREATAWWGQMASIGARCVRPLP